MTEYYETDEDPDTLAVLYRGEIEVRFITADSQALGTKDYRVLLWDKEKVVIGISSSYSRDIIDEFVVGEITRDILVSTDDEEVKREVVREMAVKHLADSLEIILEELMLDREASYIEETSFDEGLKDILDDY
jgi:hypothetical protein|tara:strand:- start:364 stop:762 length:399 start_codon:yes stop_codon:yes gene_type:complete